MHLRSSKMITWTLLLALVLGVSGAWGGSGSCASCSEGTCQTTEGAESCCSHKAVAKPAVAIAERTSCCESSGNCAITALARTVSAKESLSETSHGICRCCLVRTSTSAVVAGKTTAAESVGLPVAVLSIPGYPAAEIAWHLGQERLPHEQDTSLNVLLCRWLI